MDCRVCGNPTIRPGLRCGAAPWLGFEESYHESCSKCGEWTPKLPGFWTPTNPNWNRDRDLVYRPETVKERRERTLYGKGVWG